MDGLTDDHCILPGGVWAMRYYMDRRYWMTSGGWPDAVGFGVVDDYGVIVGTEARPLDALNA